MRRADTDTLIHHTTLSLSLSLALPYLDAVPLLLVERSLRPFALVFLAIHFFFVHFMKANRVYLMHSEIFVYATVNLGACVNVIYSRARAPGKKRTQHILGS